MDVHDPETELILRRMTVLEDKIDKIMEFCDRVEDVWDLVRKSKGGVFGIIAGFGRR